jgi:hypothetical protein
MIVQIIREISSQSNSTGHLVDRLTIRSPGHEAILELAIGVKLARQDPTDDEQEHHDAEGNQRTSLAIGSAVTVCHATSSK